MFMLTLRLVRRLYPTDQPINAISGRLTLEDREQLAPGEWEKKITDITSGATNFRVDFGNLNVAWVLFIQGIAPHIALVPYG